MKHISTLVLAFFAIGSCLAQGRIEVGSGSKFNLGGGKLSAGGSGAGERVNVKNDGDMDLSNGDVQVYGNVDNNGDMDLSNGDVQVFGNVDNDGDMDLSNGDVQVYRAANPSNVTNGSTNPGAALRVNGTTLNIGQPRSPGTPVAGSSGNLTNSAGTVDGNVGSNTTGVTSGNTRSTVNVNGNIGNNGDMDLSNGDVQVFGNVDNDGDMDLSNGDVQVFRPAGGTGGQVTNNGVGTIVIGRNAGAGSSSITLTDNNGAGGTSLVNHGTVRGDLAGPYPAHSVNVDGNVDNDGDMDLSNGDVQVFGNVDNDGDMDLSNGDVQVYRAANTTNVTNGGTNTGSTLTIGGATVNIGHPRSPATPVAGSGGSLINNTGSTTNGSGSNTRVNGNVDNDGDMDLSNGDVQVYGNIGNNGDMDLSNGDVQVYGNVNNDGDMDLSNGDVQVFRPASGTGNVNNGAGGTVTTGPSDTRTSTITLAGDFTNSGNFDTSTPGTQGSQVIFNGNPQSQSFTPGSSNYQNVQVGTTTPSVSSNVTVNGNLNITNNVNVANGDLDVTGTGNLVTLNGNATLTGENVNNSLNGRVANAQTMGSGTASESFGGNLGITINNPNAINLGTVTVRRLTNLGTGNSNIGTALTNRASIDAAYSISCSNFPTGVLPDSVQLVITWQASQDNGVDLTYPGFNSMYVTSDGSLPSPSWTIFKDNLTVTNGTSPTLARTISVKTRHFSIWSPGGFVVGVLAVDWAEANAYLVPNPAPQISGMRDAVQVDWATSAEYFVDHFAVEHSLDGKTFEEVGTVESAKNSVDIKTYSYVHTQPGYDRNFYRVKVYDQDGTQTTSRVMAVSVSKSDAFTLTYPNPMTSGDQISLYLRENAAVEAQLYTSDGRMFASFLQGNLAGSQTYRAELPVQEMTQGVYILKLNVNGEIQAHRIVIE